MVSLFKKQRFINGLETKETPFHCISFTLPDRAGGHIGGLPTQSHRAESRCGCGHKHSISRLRSKWPFVP